MHLSPRCGAKTRSGKPCRSPAMRNGRCWLHGGASLFRPLGATKFASRHAWGSRRAAYASQFLNPVDWAWRTKAKVKARVLGDADPDEWDLPPKPKWMRLRTYERWEARFDRAEDVLNQQCALAVRRLLKFKGFDSRGSEPLPGSGEEATKRV